MKTKTLRQIIGWAPPGAVSAKVEKAKRELRRRRKRERQNRKRGHRK